MVLLISYDLTDGARPENYEAVRAVIEGSAISAERPLFSQWLVETDDDVSVWSQRLVGAISPNDRLLIVRITAPYQGWLPQETWNWLQQRLMGAPAGP